MSTCCPNCGADLNKQGYSYNRHALWRCEECNQMLASLFADLGDHNFPGRIWYCDCCREMLSRRDNFHDSCGGCYCSICGSWNDINKRTVEAQTERVEYIFPDYLHNKSRNVADDKDYSKGEHSDNAGSFSDNVKYTTTYGSYCGEVSDKSRTAALVLCILLGCYGVHWFYLKRPGKGLLYLLTFSFCGIGWLIDIIMILCGGVTDGDGFPVRKW